MRIIPLIAIGMTFGALSVPAFAANSKPPVVSPVKPPPRCHGNGWGTVCEFRMPLMLSPEEWDFIKQKSDANRAAIKATPAK
jgi:hypothetical protein